MKKFNLAFLLPIVGVFLLGLFSGCTFHADKAFETVQLKLPQWPPKDGFSENYPPLSKWKIEIRSAEDCKTYFTNQETIELSVKRHTPFCTLAYPITLTQDNYQTQYFMPAGFIYPWNYKSDDAKFEWEKGIAASLMAKIFLSKIETGISTQKLNKFIGTFNWQKACETMLKTEHNPWFLESEKFLHDLCNLNFKASYSGLPDAKFKVKGIGLSKSQTWVGAGVLNEVSSKFAWYLNYDGKIDKKAKNNVFTAGVRVNF